MSTGYNEEGSAGIGLIGFALACFVVGAGVGAAIVWAIWL